jgi:hypothetical protein
MAEKTLFAYLCFILRNWKAEVWRVIRIYVVVEIIWVVVCTFTLFALPLIITDKTQLPRIGTTILIGIVGIALFTLCALAYAFLNTMSRTYWEQKAQTSALELGLVEKQHAIDARREPVFDMKGEEVVDYLFGNAKYGSSYEIGSALSIKALQKKIDVVAMRVDERKDDWIEDDRPLPVDSTEFQKNTFWILSSNLNSEGRLFNENEREHAYPPGGCIWGVGDHKILYVRPMFCRAQIVAQWPPKHTT